MTGKSEKGGDSLKRMKRIVQLLRNTKGSGLIDTIVGAFIAAVMLCLLVNVVGIGIDYYKLVVYTNAIVDSTTTTGAIDSVAEDYAQQAAHDGLSSDRLNYSWSAQYFDSSTGKLAFRQPFSLKVTYQCTLPLFFSDTNKALFSVPISYVGKGDSGVFWK